MRRRRVPSKEHSSRSVRLTRQPSEEKVSFCCHMGEFKNWSDRRLQPVMRAIAGGFADTLFHMSVKVVDFPADAGARPTFSAPRTWGRLLLIVTAPGPVTLKGYLMTGCRQLSSRPPADDAVAATAPLGCN